MGVIRWAWASLVANVTIVLTGGLVRLTDSGLGCPEWPRCTPESFVPHRALGVHGAIEFGNRLLTYVLVAVAIGTLVAVWRSAEHRSERPLAALLAAGIPAQAVIGGITVLTDLNPWIVSLHLVVSMALIAGSVVLIHRVRRSPADDVDHWAQLMVLNTFTVAMIVVYLGTMVTGSGPHSGDAMASRNGLNAMTMSHVHAISAYTLVACTLFCALALRGPASRPAALALLAVELVQAGIGIAQYNLGLPISLVAAHLVGAAVLMAAATNLLLRVRSR
jgi:cytochrome c oxidase assembly protein subunit 15